MNYNIETRKIIHQHWNTSSGSKITAMIQKYWGIGRFGNSAEIQKKSGDKVTEKKETGSDIIEFAEKLFG